ncbi:ABC transporter ATP-binding protein [Patescibacteria group bacterium]|nr:ABC transporter ATP-binding protein [Patescibacteria group bacterium]MDE1946816.1 ABC transporter ATP-binding protein [Patescibacteria group bacterium]MDE2011154.1 ABC transporter ATP-binding protein [Patescibacteria group bacterium]MDE2233063.1 ABC transporter ATP-binding protein [Patescibacteria group bacterium]
MKPVIEIKSISKSYKISHERGGYIALRDVIMNVIKSPFSFVKEKARTVAGFEKKEEFWALDNINIEINRGDVIGIIGHNGAGKSTLLKILSQITPPTKGEVIIRGKVGSLLEVGTGFNPELTGRENIFLNGAIIGMTKREISRKFDQIVDFAGISKFLDTPVKYYSSGMYVRLAFSVAAHMEPDILLVDEVLAVGDAEFQRKCLNKMEEVTHKDGRTIIFVSHSMSAIERLCKKTVLLEKGRVAMTGDTRDIISHYLNVSRTAHKVIPESDAFAGKGYKITSIELVDGMIGTFGIAYDQPIHLKLSIEVNERLENMNFAISCNSLNDQLLFIVRNSDQKEHAGETLEPGRHEFDVKIEHMLRPGNYHIGLGITRDKEISYYEPYQAVLEVSPHGKQMTIQENRGPMNAISEWNLDHEYR